MSDHHLVDGIMKERVSQHERKVVTFRSTRTLISMYRVKNSLAQ